MSQFPNLLASEQGWWLLALAGAATLAAGFAAACLYLRARLAQKETLLDAALNYVSHGLVMFDAAGRVILCNQRYMDLYRLPPGSIKPGLTLRQVIDVRIAAGAFNVDPEQYCRDVQSDIAQGKTSRKLVEFADGRSISVVGEPMASSGWVATHQDITEEKRREESFRFLFDSNPLPMWVWDHETLRFLAVNKAAEVKYGYDRETFLTLTLRDIKRTSDWSTIESAVRGDDNLRAAHASVHARADGSQFDVEYYGRSMKYEGRAASLVALIDITERKRTEDELRQTREFLDAVIESVPSMILVKDAQARAYVYANRAAEDQFGMKREQALGKTAYDVFTPAVAAAITQRDDQVLASDDDILVDSHTVKFPAKGLRSVTTRRRKICDKNGTCLYILSVIDDVTEHKQQEDELRRMRTFLDTIVENMPAMLTVKNVSDQRYALVNRAAEQFFGVRSEDMIGKTAGELFPQQAADFVEALDRDVISTGALRAIDEHVVETSCNGKRILMTKKMLVRGEDGEPQYILSLSEDVTDRKQARDQIAHMARHDSLTDLPNRAAFKEKLAALLEQAPDRMLAVLSVDIDRFKEVNDLFGHAAGDELLCEVARRLQAAAEGAFLARLGGDEFALIVADGAQPATAEATAERLLHSVSSGIQAGDQPVKIALSVGIAVYPSDGTGAAALFANANAAHYRAKEIAPGTIRFFEADMDERLRERRALQHELTAAIEHDELTLHYQPQARIGGETIGFEALVRWYHPIRGMIAPGMFIPLAEESGLIVSMGEWILREACREAASWPSPLQIAVNLSPVQFSHGDLPALVHTILLETGLAPHRLELEVTEGVLINDFARAVSILRRLKLLGVRIAMDDFGTGYSSLSYLQSFPFDKIKIDRTFIANLTDNHYSATIVRAVIGLGRGLSLPVMAEGVETAEQLAFLARESCDEVQGYLIGRPAPIENYADLVGRKTVPMLKLVSG